MARSRRSKWFLISFVLTLAALSGIAGQTTSDDPCLPENYKNLTDVHRSVSFNTSSPEHPLCDNDLVTGWHRFVVDLDGDSRMPESCVAPFQCGTTVPIWMRGTHPSASDGIQVRLACANFDAGGASYAPCCGKSIDIWVKNCGSFFVYYLNPTPACPMAYCAGKDTPCPAGQWSPTGFPPGCKDAYPRLTNPPTLRGPVFDKLRFHFTCDLTFSGNDIDQAFEFVWLFDGVPDPKVPPQIITATGRSATLEGSQLAGLLNKNVGCKVRAFYTQNANEKGPWLESSRTYWAGITTEPQHISIPTNEDRKEVVIRSTIPIVCKSEHDPLDQCCVPILISVGGTDLVVAKDCRHFLCASAWDSTRQQVLTNVTVVASKTPIQNGKQLLLLSFAAQTDTDSSSYQQIFNDFKLPAVQVDLEQRSSKLCQIGTDPHITPMEATRTFDLYDVGDYTAYENVNRSFEVQIRTWPCNRDRRDRAVTCICGVAAREKNDLIRIDGCNNESYAQNVGSPEITVPRPLRDGTRILQSSDGSSITLSFPSTAEIRVTTFAGMGGYMNLDIHVPGTDIGHGRGLCGTFDSNTNNELSHRYTGFVESWPSNNLPQRFTDTWRVASNISLFSSIPPSVVEQYSPQYCQCGADGNVNCTYQGDKPTPILPCPNCDPFEPGGHGIWGNHPGKRSDHNNVYIDIDEEGNVYDPDNLKDFRPATFSWPTSSGITESQAQTYCSNALRQSQLWSHCQDKTQKITSIIQNCKADVQVADDYIRLEAIVDAFLTICQVELAKDPNNYVSTPGGQSVMKPEISQDVCNPVCNINGNCTRGLCVCKTGFTGDNCQIKDEPPQLHNIRGSSLCDINQRPCQKIFINTSNIQNKETMGCKVQEILDDGSISRTFFMEKAFFVTLNKLICFLPDAGIRTEKSIRRFYITATIDGNLYSNALNMTVYDSSCQNCTEGGCRKLPNTCLINNLCYQDRELNPKDNSQICTVSLSTTEWSPVPTVPSDYPVITSVNLSRSDDNLFVRCVVSTDASKPTAIFRVSWGVDGVWTRELAIPRGLLEEVFSVSDFTSSHEVACRVRSLYEDRAILSPYSVSNSVVVTMTE